MRTINVDRMTYIRAYSVSLRVELLDGAKDGTMLVFHCSSTACYSTRHANFRRRTFETMCAIFGAWCINCIYGWFIHRGMESISNNGMWQA